MAGIVIQEQDLKNGRVVSMWSEAGIQFRSNLLLHPGARIELHEHNYPHVAMIVHGVFEDTDGRRVGAPARIFVPAGQKHGFTLIEHGDRPGEVLCMWGA